LNDDALIYLLPIAVYLISAGALALAEIRRRPGFRLAGLVLAVAAVVLHAWALHHGMKTPLGWNASFVNILSLVALIIAATLVVTATWTRTFEAGIIALPGAAVCVALQWLWPVEPLILGQLTVTARLNIISSLMAYCLLSIAAINALLLAAQDYALRHPKFYTRLDFLPPLTVIETLMFRLIGAGWLLLTISLGSGFVFVEDLFAQHLAHKTILSMLSWALFGLLLLARWRLGWRGRRAVRWTLLAMALLALAYFGSKLVLEVVLDRSWQGPPAG
jgi:ABC-type uncharacterized transport system permease subunit